MSIWGPFFETQGTLCSGGSLLRTEKAQLRVQGRKLWNAWNMQNLLKSYNLPYFPLFLFAYLSFYQDLLLYLLNCFSRRVSLIKSCSPQLRVLRTKSPLLSAYSSNLDTWDNWQSPQDTDSEVGFLVGVCQALWSDHFQLDPPLMPGHHLLCSSGLSCIHRGSHMSSPPFL